MNNIDDIKKEVENDSASSKDYEIEIPEKKGFIANIIDKIKSNNSTKLLGSGNKDTFQRTNRSISSMWTIASLRRVVMEKLEILNKSLFGTPEVVDQSNITTHVIGRDEAQKDDLSQTAQKSEFEPVIPVSKSAAARANRIIPQPVKTGLINDIKEKIAQTQGIEVEEVKVSEDFMEEYDIDKLTVGDVINSSKNINLVSSIEVGEINVSEKNSKEVERNDDDRDL